MGSRRIAMIVLSGALIAGGTGAAIAAVTKDDAKEVEQAVFDDAAKRLNVSPEQLRDALAAAQDAQLDQAVKDGKLTQKQADAMKAARKQSGRVLGPLGGGPHLLRGFGPGMRHGPLGRGHDLLADIAKALGTTQAKLIESLRDGTSLADIAKANGKTVAQVRAAVKSAIKTRLDKAVKAGDVTQRQADMMLERIDERLKAIAAGRPLRLHRGHHGGRPFPGGPPPADMRPGALMPGEGAPELAPPGVTFD